MENNSKEQIINNFFSKDKVKTYFKLLNENKLNSATYNLFKGIYEEIKQDVEDLFKYYKLTLTYQYQETVVHHETWWYQLYPLQQEDLDYYLPLFFREFSLYPLSFIKNLRLRSIFLVNSLDFSTHTYTQYRAAVPDYSEDTMAMIYCCKERRADYICNVIHHELFHFIDQIMYGNLYRKDREWMGFNVEGFEYGEGGAVNRIWRPLDPAIKGFLNYYSTTGIEEDKAEVFSFLINKPEEVKNNTCSILQKKMDYIKYMMGLFDEDGFPDEFWERLSSMRNKQSEF
jgi:hypothetical protein